MTFEQVADDANPSVRSLAFQLLRIDCPTVWLAFYHTMGNYCSSISKAVGLR